jgi:hypothetical protein
MELTKKQTGRIAGMIYLALAITAAFAIVYVPSQIEVKNNAAQTVANIVNNEFLFRAGIVSHLTSQVLFILLGLMLYRFLKEVNEYKARVMRGLILVQIPIVFIIESIKLVTIMVAKGELLQQFSAAQSGDVVMLLLKIHSCGIATLELFWGLWLIPFGQLIYRSGFTPKILGILLQLGGYAYILESMVLMLLPGAHASIVQFTFIFYSLAEVSIILWLLIIGARFKTKT